MSINSSLNNTKHLKLEILIRLVKAFYSEDFEENTRLIPFDMRPKGAEVPYRCCLYKERAILKDRLIAGLGLAIEEDDERTSLVQYAKTALERKEPSKNPLTVLEAACKGCVPSRIYVTDLCQGCVARPCVNTCKFDAIKIVNGKSVIDPQKCKNCGMCIGVCPYQAITKIIVPCENACPVGAIEKDEQGHAKIDFDKCIFCGKCINSCPFGAVHEKSQIIDILKTVKAGKNVIAMVAPAIAGQLPCTMGQLKSAIKQAGFFDVYEVAQGADVTIAHEAADFKERMADGQNFMTTSCCAAYNKLVKKHVNEILPFVSETRTPMFYTAQIVKKEHPDSVCVFVSPCVSKRAEALLNPNVDYVMSFEELGALFVALKIELMNCPEDEFKVVPSREARNFPVSHGVANAVASALEGEVEIKPYVISGIDKKAVRELKKYGKEGICPEGNLIEVMSCAGGCISGNACINAQKIAIKQISKFSEDAKSINNTVKEKQQ